MHGVALEGNVDWETLGREPYAQTAVIELGVVPGGYGWVFPKGDHANLGVGGWAERGPTAARPPGTARRSARCATPRCTQVKGHRLPMRRLGRDAGGADACCSSATPPASSTRCPVTGSTRRSSRPRLAARVDPRRRPRRATRRRSSTALDHHAAASWAAKRAMDRSAAACFWAARSPGVFSVVAGLLGGDVAHPSEARGLARPPLRLLARLAS